MIEFTVIFPLLLLMTFGIIQYGMLFLTYTNMYNAARETARRWAVAEFATEALAEADISGRRSAVASWVPAADWDVSGTKKVGNQLTVMIQVPSSSASVVNLPLLPLPATLIATVVMREE